MQQIVLEIIINGAKHANELTSDLLRQEYHIGYPNTFENVLVNV